MTAWPTTPLGTVCDVVGGGTPSRDTAEYFGGDIPWITPTDVTRNPGRYLAQGNETITEIGLLRSSAKLLPARSVLLTSRATIGFTAINTVPVTTNQGFASFVCGPHVYPEYLAYWFEWSRDRLVELASGATFKEINKSTLKRLEIPLPPLDEQRRIVGLLDRAAEIRRRADAARAKARAIIPALFLETFGDPATNPKGWPVATVGELLASATYGTSQKANDRATGIPIIRMGNVTTSGQLNTINLKHLEISGQEREKAELIEGDLLFNRTNSKELVGKTGLWDGRFEGVAASYFIRLRVDRASCNPTYLWAFFNSRHMKQVLFETARGAIGQANINAKELRAFRVPLAPLLLQKAFAEQTSRLQAVARQLDAAAAKSEAMTTALSAEVFG